MRLGGLPLSLTHTEQTGLNQIITDVITEVESDDMDSNHSSHQPELDLLQAGISERIAEHFREKRKNRTQTGNMAEAEWKSRSYPLMEIQKKYLKEMQREEGKLSARLAQLIEFPLSSDSGRICDAVQQMIRNRPAFGTIIFRDENGVPRQRYDAGQLPEVHVEKMTEEEFSRIKDGLLKPFVPYGRSFGFARVFETERRILLLVGMSHVMTDGTGARLCMNDLVNAYQGRELTPDTYYAYLSLYERRLHSREYEAAKEYYIWKYGSTNWLRCLPGDLDGKDHERVFFLQPLNYTDEQLADMRKKHSVGRNVFFAAVVLLSVAKFASRKAVLMNWTDQNRRDKIAEAAVGVVMARLPYGIVMDDVSTLADVYSDLRKQTLMGIANNAYEWVSLTETDLSDETMSYVYQPRNVLGDIDITALGAHFIEGAVPNPATARKLAFMIYEDDKKTNGFISYMKGFYSQEYIGRLYRCFEETLDEFMKTEDPEAFSIRRYCSRS